MRVTPKNETQMNTCSSRKYLIVGTGGVGGMLGGFLTLAGCDVTCIARGEHLQAIRAKGLRLKSALNGTQSIPVKACTSETYNNKADVIFVCVKGYGLDSAAALVRQAAHRDTLVIPVLNVYGIGERIQRLAEDVNVLDGCIYIVSHISAPGEITWMGKIFRVVYGARKGQNISPDALEAVRDDLTRAGIKAVVSDDIDRETFVKWTYISSMACTGAYFDVAAGAIQQAGPERDMFIGLTRENAEIGRRRGIAIPDDLLESHLRILDHLEPESTASLQKDLAKGHASEIDGILFQMIRMAEETGVDIPFYRQVAAKFRKQDRDASHIYCIGN
jgi:2-dehydropantoate 2-reductase